MDEAAIKIYLIDEKYEELIDKLVDTAENETDMGKAKGGISTKIITACADFT